MNTDYHGLLSGGAGSATPGDLGLFGRFRPDAAGGILGGLLGQGGSALTPFQPSPNEGFITRIFGDHRNQLDPRPHMMTALAEGLMGGRGGLAITDALRAHDAFQGRQGERLFNNLRLAKTGLELQAMQDRMGRSRSIQSDLEALRKQASAPEAGPAYAPSGSDAYGVPTFGGVPMFSIPPQSQSRPALGVGGGQGAGGAGAGAGGSVGLGGGGQAGPMQKVVSDLLAEAEIYRKHGDAETANELYQRVAQLRTKHSLTPQLMRDPRTNQLVQVVMNEDGGYQVLPFGAKPDIELVDLGDRRQAIDKNATEGGQSWKKGYSPSDRINAGQLQVSRDRLAYERGKPEVREINGQLVAVYPNAPGGPRVGAIEGAPGVQGEPKLTEAQGNATQFITRMRDASRVLDQFSGDKAPWPSTVERAGYKPVFPDWAPGGQVASAGISAVNKALTPDTALQVLQAQNNWLTANLRKESGAAIPIPELEAERAKWFPMPGEGAEVAKQKAAARRVAEEAMMSQAGPGKRLVEGNLQRADAETAKRDGKPEQGLDSVPAANALNRGRKIRDNQTGAVYESDGLQWKRVK